MRAGGVDVAGLGDLQGMKLKVVGDRGELRDYHEIHTIETQAYRRIEEGLGIMVEVYRPQVPTAWSSVPYWR